MQFCFALALAIVVASVACAGEQNLCVECHRAQELPISLGHTFHDWHGSEHGRAGVGCEKCHGGDSKASDPARAHQEVLPASEPKSMVNPVVLPRTCGGCHPPALAAFASTVHAKVLQAAGRGPTCSMCHGAMATSLPSPVELDTRCETCHKKPVEAKKALAVLANAKVQLYKARAAVAAVKSSNPKWYASGLERFHEIERSFASVAVTWHTFDMARVREQCHDILTLTKALVDEAEIQARRGGE